MDLAQQEVKLTYCFYENPAAKQEIKFWESLVEKHIVSKSFIGDHWGYRLEKEDGIEFVCCIPLDNLIGYEFSKFKAYSCNLKSNVSCKSLPCTLSILDISLIILPEELTSISR